MIYQLGLTHQKRLSTAHTFEKRMAAYVNYIDQLEQYQKDNKVDLSDMITEVKQSIESLQRAQSKRKQPEPCRAEPGYARVKRETKRQPTSTVTFDGQGLFNDQTSNGQQNGFELP